MALWKPKSDGERQRSVAGIGVVDGQPASGRLAEHALADPLPGGLELVADPSRGLRDRAAMRLRVAEPRDAALDAGQVLGERETGFRTVGQAMGRRVELVLVQAEKKAAA